MSLSHQTMRRASLTAEQRRAAAREQALLRCGQGEHQTMPTFRAGEHVCLICGLVLYCPSCLAIHHLPLAQARRLYALPCPAHQDVAAGRGGEEGGQAV